MTYKSEFYLDFGDSYAVTGPSETNGTPPRWGNVAHTDDQRTALFLIAGDVFRQRQPVRLLRDSQLYIRYTAALQTISSDGLELKIRFVGISGDSYHLICLPISGGTQPAFWRELTFDLSFMVGHIGIVEIEICPGPVRDSSADWAAIADLCITSRDRLQLVRASSLHTLRTNNEIAHFSATYRHEMYNSPNKVTHANLVPLIRRMTLTPSTGVTDSDNWRPEFAQPLEKETAFGFAARMLGQNLLPMSPPDFLGRLKARVQHGKKVRILSLCSGAARIEASFAAEVGDQVDWSLFDINADLLGLAASRFPEGVSLDLIQGNVNELAASGEKWDVILCISALHHVVELERVIRFCHDSLAGGGEFWSIGEYVGRNGNRLWGGSWEAANAIFSKLPERYRLNRHTGMVDMKLPDNDYSVGCFEGIRSEDIEPIIARWFKTEEIYRRNCFLWRLTNLAYSENYDLSDQIDIAWLQRMVQTELEYFRENRQGTELFAVYRPIYRQE